MCLVAVVDRERGHRRADAVRRPGINRQRMTRINLNCARRDVQYNRQLHSPGWPDKPVGETSLGPAESAQRSLHRPGRDASHVSDALRRMHQTALFVYVRVSPQCHEGQDATLRRPRHYLEKSERKKKMFTCRALRELG